MKEIKNNSRLARILVYSGVALCVVAALMYLENPRARDPLRPKLNWPPLSDAKVPP